MLLRPWRSPVGGHRGVDQDFDALIVRIRRLAAHRGYDRDALMSPMLKRLMPTKRPSKDPAMETAELRRHLQSAGLDANALDYLLRSIETELDFARLRLT